MATERENLCSVKVSIIIPTYNRGKLLNELLLALSKQTYPHDRLEIIIVNDAGPDSDHRFIEQTRLSTDIPIFYFRNKINKGPAFSRNIGLKHATGDLILFLDDDVMPSPELVERHVYFHRRFPNSMSQGAVIPAPDTHPIDRFIWKTRFNLKLPHGQDLEFGCATANLSIFREFLMRIGGFDETLRIYEDTDMGFRLLKATGIHSRLNKEAEVLHRKHSGLDKIIIERWMAGKHCIQVLRKEPSLVHPKYSTGYRKRLAGSIKAIADYCAWDRKTCLSKLAAVKKLESRYTIKPTDKNLKPLERIYAEVIGQVFQEGGHQEIYGIKARKPALSAYLKK